MSKNYTIKHLTIDFDDHIIKSHGIELTIDYKAVEVLKMLLENSGQTISNDAFMDKVWADKPSSPEVVTSAIARLRKLFKTSGIADEMIVTVHKVGYRFDKPVETETISAKAPFPKVFLYALLSLLAFSLLFNVKQIYQKRPQQNLNLSHSDIASINNESESNVTQIFLLRHAEKTSVNEENPALSTKGIVHAQYWKKVLQHIKFDRVFTTNFKRNIKTAEILSTDLNIKPELYYPMSFEVLRFIEEVQGQKVLIIGHSNTIPDMVNRIIDETKYPPMSHKNYNLMYLININKNGDTSSSLLHIEMPE